MQISLSVVLATYNEAANIKDCLLSVKTLADEIIIVDGSSQDKTREIAKTFSAKVFQVTNKPIFHINKQLAVDKASGKWILQLDADERVSPELAREIKKIINQPHPQFNGYYLPRKNFFLTRFLTKGGQYPDYIIRLFLNGKGSFPCETVHEQIIIDGPVGYLTNPIIHYSDRHFSRYLTRFNRYTSLAAAKLKQENFKPSLWLCFQYFIIKPKVWFFSTYFRHKGFVDGLPGFIFSLMSALRFPVIYLKFWELNHENRH
ncbi:MAG: glycosyltransferase family 2 protein [Candidatus Beckwithbacteria bacterium]|nr:glycosyltransferase family 2 protein [Candidatus Beckwithbacteria bacterium]